MAEEEMRRTIGLPKSLWKLIDEDAEFNKRSAVKQMEVVLSSYYGLRQFETPSDRLRDMFIASMPSAQPSEAVNPSNVAITITPGSIEETRKLYQKNQELIEDAVNKPRKLKHLGDVGERNAEKKRKAS